jgi:hypothetical protein
LYGKSTPFRWLARDSYIASEGLGEVLDNGEAEAGATEFSRTRFVDSIESFKHPCEMFFVDPDSGVTYVHANGRILLSQDNRYFATFGRVFDGVAYQVVDDLSKTFFIRLNSQVLLNVAAG